MDVKICGLRDEAMIRVAAEAGATWIGFVLFERSPRNILEQGPNELDTLKSLSSYAKSQGVKSAVLLVDPAPELITKLLDIFTVDALQLHGTESPDFVAATRHAAAGKTEVWKAMSVSSTEVVDALGAWEVDRLLLDAPPPESATRPGGNGDVFDWSLLKQAKIAVPWFLAGGLTPDNVKAAIAATRAPGVDVSTGVERARGVKDEQLIRAFVAAALSA